MSTLTTQKTIQSNILENINKSRWNTRKCLGNPQEGKKNRETEKMERKIIKWQTYALGYQ